MLPADYFLAAPLFTLVFLRVCGAILLLPGLGESAAPAMTRIGLAVAITLLLLPGLPLPASLPDGSEFMLSLLSELFTGLWFGWLVRMVALALPMAGQLMGYLLGLSSVLQPDPELGAQSNVFGTWFGMMAPVFFLVSGLYTYPLKALRGLFELIPLGRMLPADGGADVAVASVLKVFELSLQLASPFILFAILWYFIMGHLSRMAGRMQIYFVSVPGQILLGLLLMAALMGTLLTSWEHNASVILEAIPEVR